MTSSSTLTIRKTNIGKQHGGYACVSKNRNNIRGSNNLDPDIAEHDNNEMVVEKMRNTRDHHENSMWILQQKLKALTKRLGGPRVKKLLGMFLTMLMSGKQDTGFGKGRNNLHNSDQGRARIGRIVRDSNGKMVMAFSIPVTCTSNNMVKALATDFGGKWCSQQGLTNFTLELDSIVIVNMMKNR
ncbi:hypothetical protein HAX54_021701 [Datura stramonium]|uniref:RNase H type-1 domain-containing protein n=1 Tax=Datura stramonium TaxID=4076 RepID=A0ABS8UTA9_DATST|nr:hypothetical protein [Datura stramonium]